MNRKYEIFVKLIKKSIYGKKINLEECRNTNWEDIREMSKSHKIEALIYSSLTKDVKDSMDKFILEEWKKEAFISGVKQQTHMKEVEKVLHKFNEENINVLVLKGLVIRDLYPNSSLRTMSDSDIVVKEEDLHKSIELILSQGYKEIERSPSHYVYYKSGCLPIELHWNLADEHFFKKINLFEEDMWKSVEDINIGLSKAKNMSLEDLAIFQCIHMAKHLVYRGFGVRHLIDFVLLVEKRGQDIDWINFLERCKKYGIYKFVIKVILTCNTLFHMNVPKEIEFILNEDKSYLDEFVNDILDSGVHGKQDFISSVASEFAYDANKDGKENESSLKRYIKFLFPKVENMSDTYNYAKKYKVLHPVAWGHHLVRGVCNKDYSLSEKIKFTTETVSVSQKRNNLINWLEL